MQDRFDALMPALSKWGGTLVGLTLLAIGFMGIYEAYFDKHDDEEHDDEVAAIGEFDYSLSLSLSLSLSPRTPMHSLSRMPPMLMAILRRQSDSKEGEGGGSGQFAGADYWSWMLVQMRR